MKPRVIETIKIAPSIDEIIRRNNVIECEFNEMKIKWVLALDGTTINSADVVKLKCSLQQAIAFSSKTHQIARLLGTLRIPSTLYVNGTPFAIDCSRGRLKG